MRRLVLLLVSTLAAGLLVVATGQPAAAAACTFRQLTSTEAGSLTRGASISDDGTVVAFVSDGDLAVPPQNADENRELYLVDLATGGEPEQVTVSLGDEIPAPELSGNGQRIAFASDDEYGDGGDNGDGSSEIWLYDRALGPAGILQLTNSSDASFSPTISDDGTRIAFTSNADLTGDNPDENREVFLVDTVADTTTQITVTTAADNNLPIISDDGTRIAFTSGADLTGDTPDGGRDLFLHDTTDDSFTQLIDVDDTGIEPQAFNGNGNRLVLQADTVDITGQNPDLSYEIFVHNVASGVTTQLTSIPNADLYAESPAIDGTGNRVVFLSDADIVGEDPGDGYQLYAHDRIGRVGFDQLTPTLLGSEATSPTVNADGTRIAVSWAGDPVGDNADGSREIFLLTCGAAGPTYTDVPAGNFFYEPVQWMGAAEIANGFPGGLFKPLDPVNRQQMANFLYNLAGQPAFAPPVPPTFSDVPTTNPFYLQIEWMAAEGIANGFPNGTFKPLDPVKRQQMANFLYNLADQPDFDPPVPPTFSDVPASNPFHLQIEWMVAEGIANGFPGGIFKPLDPVKRQQMANFLLNLVNGPGVDLE